MLHHGRPRPGVLPRFMNRGLIEGSFGSTLYHICDLLPRFMNRGLIEGLQCGESWRYSNNFPDS